MSRQLDALDDLVVDYLRSRGRVDVPPDLVLSMVDAARSQPQQRASWFGAFVPAAAAVASIVLVVIVAGLVTRPSAGPSPSSPPTASMSPSSAPPVGLLMAAGERCRLEQFTWTVPEQWYANRDQPDLPGCTLFSPKAFNPLTANLEEMPIHLGIEEIGPIAFPANESAAETPETVADLPATRYAVRLTGNDEKQLRYVIYLDGSRDFAGGTERVLSMTTALVPEPEYASYASALESIFQELRAAATAGAVESAAESARDRRPMLQAAIHETNDIVSDATFYLGYSDGTTVYAETFTRDQLDTSAWFGPFGGHFLRVSFEGGRSTVSELTLTGGTPRPVYTADGAFLAATMSPDGKWIYLSRTDAALNEDFGIWRIGADGGEAVRILAPNADRPVNRGQRGSLLTWTPDGKLLVVQNCRGDRGDDCTWTLVDGETGEVVREVVPERTAGLLVGIANDRLLAGRNCNGLSCTSSLVDFLTAHVTSADGPGQRETLIESESGPILLRDSGPSYGSYRITATQLDTGREWTAYESSDPRRMLVTLERPFGGVQLDPGWFALADEGQFGTRHLAAPLIVNAVDQHQIELVNLGD
jgi:hypothetical protein